MFDPDRAEVLVIFGVHTPYFWEVRETAGRAGFESLLLVDYTGQPDPGIGVVALADAPYGWIDLPVVLGSGLPEYRRPSFAAAEQAGAANWHALVDPTSVIARTATVEPGSYINALSVVGARTVVRGFAHINRNASVGHDCCLEPFATVGPGANVSSESMLGESCFVGAGAVVLPGIKIGQNAVVGAGAVVTKDVSAGNTVVGNPARTMEDRNES